MQNLKFSDFPFSFLLSEFLVRITKTTHTRHYRYSKKNPRAFRQVTTYDLGNVEQSTHLSFRNKNLIKNDIETRKEKNPNLFSIRIGEIVLKIYIDSEKGFCYDKNGFYSGTFLKHDIIHAYSQFGAFLKKIKVPLGYSTVVDNGTKEKVKK